MEKCFTKYHNDKIYSVEYRNEFGKLHREDGPAYIEYYENGNIRTEEWFTSDSCYRKNGPSIVNYYDNGNKKSEYWFFGSKLHREDGPAIIYYNKNGKIIKEKYFVNGKRIDNELQFEILKINNFLNILN